MMMDDTLNINEETSTTVQIQQSNLIQDYPSSDDSELITDVDEGNDDNDDDDDDEEVEEEEDYDDDNDAKIESENEIVADRVHNDDNQNDNDNDSNYNPTSSSFPIPVGITIAYKRKNSSSGLTPSKERIGKTSNPSTSAGTKGIRQLSRAGGNSHRRITTRNTSRNNRNTTTTTTTERRLRGGYRKPVPSFTVFVEGTTLYTICLILPTLLGLILNFYDDVNLVDWKRTSTIIVQTRIDSIKQIFHHSIDNICSYYDIDSGEYYFDEILTFYPSTDDNLLSQSSTTSTSTGSGDTSRSTITSNPTVISTTTYVKKVLYNYSQIVYNPIFRLYIKTTAYWLHRSGLCDKVAELLQLQEDELEQQLFNQYVVSKDTAYWVQDTWIILFCSTILAMVRIWIVQGTVPLEDSTTVEALVRCKSVHLLSADYATTMTPVSTPMPIRKVKRARSITTGTIFQQDNIITPLLLTPDLNYDRQRAQYRQQQQKQQQEEQQHSQTMIHQSDSADVGMRWDETEADDNDDDNNNYNATPTFLQKRVASSSLLLDDAETDDEEIIHVSKQQQEQILTGQIISSLSTIQLHQQGEQQFDEDITKNYSTSSTLSPTSKPYDKGLHQHLVVDDEYSIPKLSSSSIGTSPPVRTRVNAAPRYATALFRLVWSTVSSVLALYYFRKTNFWPWYVGGTGATANCWDLSGGLSVGGMDSDFDHSNAVLKRYFLGQASYHWHSGAFHILSMLILLLHPSTKIHHPLVVDDEFEDGAGGLVDNNNSNTNSPQISTRQKRNNTSPISPSSTSTSNRSSPSHQTPIKLLFGNSSTVYIRSMAQHVLALALIASAYVFSSLRRLGVIGMFAFDVSNWFLHLLQVCMNAPSESQLKNKRVISTLYWIGVLPSFVIARFFVWPLLWYSAAFESRRWLVQLEKTLWIGSASALRWIFHIWMVLIQILNMVYLYRLLYHPHFIKVLSQAPLSTRKEYKYSSNSRKT